MAYDKEQNRQTWNDFISQPPVDEKFIGKQLDIAAQIDTYLKETGWTQKKLAEEAGLRPSQLSKIMAGEANPTLRTITNIEEALGKDIIVCPEFHEEDMEEKGWTHPERVTVIASKTYRTEQVELEYRIAINTNWQKVIRVKPHQYSNASEYHLTPTGTNG